MDDYLLNLAALYEIPLSSSIPNQFAIIIFIVYSSKESI